jgi:hypothetical protein
MVLMPGTQLLFAGIQIINNIVYKPDFVIKYNCPNNLRVLKYLFYLGRIFV